MAASTPLAPSLVCQQCMSGPVLDGQSAALYDGGVLAVRSTDFCAFSLGFLLGGWLCVALSLRPKRADEISSSLTANDITRQ